MSDDVYAVHDRLYREMRERPGAIGWQGNYEAHQEQVRRALEGPHAPRTGSVLELGCGAGNMALWLATRGFTPSGIDISATAIEWAKEHAATSSVAADFRQGSLTELPWAEDAFDFVFDGNAFHCVLGDDRRIVLEETARVLRPGGYFLVRTVCTPVREADLNPAYPYDAETRISYLGETPFRYLVHPDELEREVAAAGLEICATHALFGLERGSGFSYMMLEARLP